MSFGDIVQASIQICNEGMAVYSHMRDFIALEENGHRRTNRAGKRTLGRARGCEGRFYSGDIAQTIVAFLSQHGSYLEYSDMAGFRSRYEEPVVTRWRDFDVVTCGPWCQGPMLGQALKLVERAGLDGLAHNSADYIHLLVEVLKAAFSDREYRYGNPLFVDVGLTEMMSDDHIAQRVAAIDRAKPFPACLLLSVICPTAPIGRAAAKSDRQRPRTRCATPPISASSTNGAMPSRPPASDGNWSLPIIPDTGLTISGRGVQ
jgi:gamma-glutamyltranspeptidase/glutathione hydrolase